MSLDEPTCPRTNHRCQEDSIFEIFGGEMVDLGPLHRSGRGRCRKRAPGHRGHEYNSRWWSNCSVYARKAEHTPTVTDSTSEAVESQNVALPSIWQATTSPNHRYRVDIPTLYLAPLLRLAMSSVKLTMIIVSQHLNYGTLA